MSWFRKPLTSEIPVVPDDRLEREAALEKSRAGLREAQSRIEPVRQLTTSISQHYDQNHYALRLQRAYGKIPS